MHFPLLSFASIFSSLIPRSFSLVSQRYIFSLIFPLPVIFHYSVYFPLSPSPDSFILSSFFFFLLSSIFYTNSDTTSSYIPVPLSSRLVDVKCKAQLPSHLSVRFVAQLIRTLGIKIVAARNALTISQVSVRVSHISATDVYN